ncbi:MAG TPA: hypothetical protein VH186_11230 [Chloroflexia bacterium]|nr:hypothetical protein [Chloroflexia bacterium]
MLTVVNYLIPSLLMIMFPLDLVAGLAKGSYPTQASLMSALATILGIYLARKLWRGGAERLEAGIRMQVVNRQGSAFDPASDDVQVQLDNAKLNSMLGSGFMFFGIALNFIFILTYVITEPINATPTVMGQLVQLAVIALFNIMVAGITFFGARIYLKR